MVCSLVVSVHFSIQEKIALHDCMILRLGTNFKVSILMHYTCHCYIYSVITDAREWRFYKQLNGLQTPIEEGMFNKQSKGKFAEIFLRPKETVYIPFKYLSFKADHSVHPQVCIIGSLPNQNETVYTINILIFALF